MPARAITPPDLALLLRVSAARGNIVALTFSTCERCFSAGQLRLVDRALQDARDRHVSVLVATGDQGPLGRTFWGAPAHARGVGRPTASPLVTAVGGTRLAVDHDGGYASESVWDLDYGRRTRSGLRITTGGGGVSSRYARPAFQRGLPVIGSHRGVPDVAAVADRGLATVMSSTAMRSTLRAVARAPLSRCGPRSPRWLTGTPTVNWAF